MTAVEARFSPGDVIGERFRVTRWIATGGMGSVLAAVDLRTRREVALKVMREELTADATSIERFKREADVLSQIAHPAIVGLMDAGTLEDGTLYLALELLHGETLKRRLTRHGPLSPAELLPLLQGICDGLAAAHEVGVVHRDIKPANIFLPGAKAIARARMTGEIPLVKLVDFGVAKVFGMSRLTTTGIAVGTLRYMAPEQLRGADVDARTDVYAVGVVMYEALSGVHPFGHVEDDLLQAILQGRRRPLSDVADVGPAVESIVGRAMALDPADRYPGPRELAAAYLTAVQQPELVSKRTAPERPAVKLSASSAVTLPSTPAVTGSEPAQPSGAPAPAAKRDALIPPTRPGMAAVRIPALPPAGVEAPDSEPAGRRRRPRHRRRTLWPWLAAAGIVLTLGIGAAGLACAGGCRVVTDGELASAAALMRAAMEHHPDRERFEVDLSRLEQLHREGRTNWLAIDALDTRVYEAIADDNTVDPDELTDLMAVVRDINDHGGTFTWSHWHEVIE